jgi:uncharacterized protein
MKNYDTYVITGGTGFIGRAICKALMVQQKKVYVLTRGQNEIRNNVQFIHWDIPNNKLDMPIKESNVAVIHLAGAGVADKRWNDKRKQEIATSRTATGDSLFALIKSGQIKASAVAAASAIGYYEATDTKALEEDAQAGNDYLATTCIAWEKSSAQIRALNIPVSIHRIGLVMGAGGGAIQEFSKTLKFRIAGIPGDGRQIYSWIHINDVTQQFLFALNHQLNDVYNAVSPNPVSAAELIKSLASEYMGIYISINAPSFILKLMLGEMSIEILKSNRVSSNKIINTGFKHAYGKLNTAMAEIAEALKNP